MATGKSPIQLRWDHSDPEAVTVRLVEKKADGDFEELVSKSIKLADIPDSLNPKLVQKGIVAFCDAKVTGIKQGREKYDTVANLLFPKIEEGVLEDNRGASIEERAVQQLSNQTLKVIRTWQKEAPDQWKALLEKPEVQEKIEELRQIDSKNQGKLELSDLLGGS